MLRPCRKEEKVHDSSSTLAHHIFELESYPEVERKRHQETITAVTKENCCVEEAQKALQQEKESCGENQSVHDGQERVLNERVQGTI